ncbi:MAG TPA: polysaccharide biosynthesis/export family protein [Candidatus Polarisedimenticolia bacterium]
MRDIVRVTAILMLAASGPGVAAAEAPPRPEAIGNAPSAAAPSAVPALPAGTEAATSDYLIGPGDLLEVTVFEEESLNRTVRVGPDGAISLPLLGEIRIGGLSKSHVEAEIVRRLGEHFLFDPQVSVFVKEYRSRRVAVMGAVREPGSYELLGPRTLLELIAEAGGLAENAGRDLFVFGRGADGSISRSRVDLNRLLREGDASLNLLVREGEIIQVPVDKPFAVYLYGAVATPGLVEGRSSDGLTLLQAIARAGGPGQRAAVERITIMRARPDGSRERMRANLKRIIQGRADDPRLEPDDIVVVPEAFF